MHTTAPAPLTVADLPALTPATNPDRRVVLLDGREILLTPANINVAAFIQAVQRGTVDNPSNVTMPGLHMASWVNLGPSSPLLARAPEAVTYLWAAILINSISGYSSADPHWWKTFFAPNSSGSRRQTRRLYRALTARYVAPPLVDLSITVLRMTQHMPRDERNALLSVLTQEITLLLSSHDFRNTPVPSPQAEDAMLRILEIAEYASGQYPIMREHQH